MQRLDDRDGHGHQWRKPSPLAERLAAALTDGSLTPAHLGLAEVELRYLGHGWAVEWVDADRYPCPLVVRRITADGTVGPDEPHCPQSAIRMRGSHLVGIGGTYAGAVEQTAPHLVRFTDLDAEPDLVIRAAVALDHIDRARSAAQVSAHLDRLGETPPRPPELGL